MSLWFVPGALVAVALVPLAALALRAAAEVAMLRQEVARARSLRPALVELSRDARAVAAHARELRRRD